MEEYKNIDILYSIAIWSYMFETKGLKGRHGGDERMDMKNNYDGK